MCSWEQPPRPKQQESCSSRVSALSLGGHELAWSFSMGLPCGAATSAAAGRAVDSRRGLWAESSGFLEFDRGYDSDPLRKRLAERGIELIAQHRWNRSKPVTQDGRALRLYRRRWKVERTLAWLGNFRHLVVRYDRSLTIYGAFFHIACFMIDYACFFVFRSAWERASSSILAMRRSRASGLR